MPIDASNLPINSTLILAGALWAGISFFVLGEVVADRMIEKTNWSATCQQNLNNNLVAKLPEPKTSPSVSCEQILGVFGQDLQTLCRQGGNELFDLLSLDPLAAQKEQLRRQETARLARIAALSPSRCDCAARVVSADRLSWGLYAGSARLIGGPQNLQSTLTQALHSPVCTLNAEG